MKSLALASSLLAVLTVFACDSGSAVTECTTDADCPADQPVCDTSSDPGICVPDDEGDDPECTDDLQCQVTDIGSSATCDANSDCDTSEACVEGSNQENHCVVLEGTGCAGFAAVDATDADGNDVSICVDDGVGCNADGACE